ncbi:MAG: hypothetical protein F6J93_02175 [Oscillatoria sp. SIO1A7]|nr:hypothetical protein [Oscillatoria sp. SIO1A7]
MGEAKRRREYFAKQGKTPPPNQGNRQATSPINRIKDRTKQVEADTKRAKQDRYFKLEAQKKHENLCRSITEKLANRDFGQVGEIMAAISARENLDLGQIELWQDYTVAGLLNTHHLDAVQAQLFVRELAIAIVAYPNQSRQEYLEEQRQIEAEKAFLKTIENWIYTDNPLFAIYGLVSPDL